MRKTVFIYIAICAVLLGGYIHYTYEASKECESALRMTRALLNNGAIDTEDATYYYRAIARSRNMVYPVRTLHRLQLINRNLQHDLDRHNERLERERQKSENTNYTKYTNWK